MGPGGLPGLQNRCCLRDSGQAEFDSQALPPTFRSPRFGSSIDTKVVEPVQLHPRQVGSQRHYLTDPIDFTHVNQPVR